MEDLGDKNTASDKNEIIDSDDKTINEVIRVVKTKLSQRQKKDLGLVKPKQEYKKQRTPAQLAHDERLRSFNREKAEVLRKEKEDYEVERLKKFHLEAEQKQKRKNNVKSITDDEEYQKFLEFKKIREIPSPITKPQKKPKEEIAEESSDDGFIQSKTKKTQKIEKAIQEIDNKINKFQNSAPVNPYLELFNKKK
jgi:hypothetical protein